MKINRTCPFCLKQFPLLARHVLADCAADMRRRVAAAEARTAELEARLTVYVGAVSETGEMVCEREGCGLPVMREGQHNHILDCGVAAQARIKQIERKAKESL